MINALHDTCLADIDVHVEMDRVHGMNSALAHQLNPSRSLWHILIASALEKGEE